MQHLRKQMKAMLLGWAPKPYDKVFGFTFFTRKDENSTVAMTR